MTSLDNVSFYLFVILLISVSDVNSKNTTVEEKIKYDSDLSEFYSHLETNAMANATLMYRELTVFAPTNKAFQNYRSNISIDSLVSYHMVTSPVSFDRLYSGQSLSTDFPGNPYVWITRKSQNEVYVNNARIDRYKSNYVAWNTNRKQQVLHVIGEVLEPVVSTNPERPIYNPDALTFLNQSEEIALGSHRLRTFRQRVHQLNKQHIFQASGHYTFFIPIDDGFTPPPRSDKIDAKVIDGHVIPRYVLFTGPTPQGHEYPTLAMGDMMKVTVSFTQQNDGKHPRTYVKSSTLQGDSTHANGVVLAEIVRANIPVKNGVVHLIHRPLMVVDSTVTQFLKDDVDGPLYRFYRVILENGGDFMNRINRMREVTLFAPSNDAWNEKHLEIVLKDPMKLREILDLHLVDTKLPVDQIISNNQKEIFMASTSDGRRNLYFNVVQGPYNNRTLTVEGGGVNATVIQPDIAATNGVIHIIDHVLGVPYQNVKEKLLTDPMLNKTATLGQKTHFNEQLKNTNRKFTYFVPRDYAWKKAEVQFPSAHKKLFMPEFVYHVQQILERHLVINDRAYTMAELKNMTNDSYITLPTLRDSLKIKVKEVDRSGHGYDVTNNYHAPRKGYALEWRGETVHVFRPDVYCTNGIIHVIDRVLLQESDVRVNAEPALESSSLFLNLCLVLIAKFYF